MTQAPITDKEAAADEAAFNEAAFHAGQVQFWRNEVRDIKAGTCLFRHPYTAARAASHARWNERQIRELAIRSEAILARRNGAEVRMTFDKQCRPSGLVYERFPA